MSRARDPAPGFRDRDAQILIGARGLRGFADGLMSIALPLQLAAAGWDAFGIGGFLTATLLGSALCTLAVGLAGSRTPPRFLLLAAALLMLLTGAGLAAIDAVWALLALAFFGTLNPGASDVSVFLPTEQALLAEAAPPRERTSHFARYNVAGSLAGALGSLACGATPAAAARLGSSGLGLPSCLVYSGIALALLPLYARLRAGRRPLRAEASAPLARSRRSVLQLTALFSLDSFAGGFALQSLLVLWLSQRFGLGVEEAGLVFFAAGLLSAVSQLASPWLARRIGLVETMAYTHLPANALLIAAALMPDAASAVACLLLRAALSQMDVPARQSLVMSLVPPEERPAAASLTNVPRSLAAGVAPLFAGGLLGASGSGWPLVCAGLLKIAYDLLLLARFRGRESAA